MSRISNILLTAVAATALAACASPPRDPASEAPVDPTPGLYQITLSGAGLAQYVQDGPGKVRDEICVTASDSPRFADRVVKNYLFLHPRCTVRANPRVGNVIGGAITCPLDPEKATGTMTVDYEGAISAEGVETTSRMTLKMRPLPGSLTPEETRQLALGEALMENVGVQIKAVRTADCG